MPELAYFGSILHTTKVVILGVLWSYFWYMQICAPIPDNWHSWNMDLYGENLWNLSKLCRYPIPLPVLVLLIKVCYHFMHHIHHSLLHDIWIISQPVSSIIYTITMFNLLMDLTDEVKGESSSLWKEGDAHIVTQHQYKNKKHTKRTGFEEW